MILSLDKPHVFVLVHMRFAVVLVSLLSLMNRNRTGGASSPPVHD